MVERRLVAKFDVNRLPLQVVHENEPELVFRGGKVEWQKFCETTSAKDQKKLDPVWHEAIL